ncbi:MAG: diguanylate cyclase [Oceanobacter sp.]
MQPVSEQPSSDNLSNILDALPEQVVVLDEEGTIVYVNQSWIDFGLANQGEQVDWSGLSYLGECQKAVDSGDLSAVDVVQGIREVLNGKEEHFQHEYPCHSVDEHRWFHFRLFRVPQSEENRFLGIHYDITEKVLSEQKTKRMANEDALTGVFNRRGFEAQFDLLWERCHRLVEPMSIAILDLDNFKEINDLFGHQVGDRCLGQLADLLREYTDIPASFCARLGGDEFVLAWASMSVRQARFMIKEMMEDVQAIRISGVLPVGAVRLSISVGLADFVPSPQLNQSNVLKTTDDLLYQAKRDGKAKLKYQSIDVASTDPETNGKGVDGWR